MKETPEEAIENRIRGINVDTGFKQERMYSEEDLKEAIVKSALSNTDNIIERCNEIIEQFKKK
jgi:hypothetical protein